MLVVASVWLGFTEPAHAGLIIRQRSTGVPGQQAQSAAAPQILKVGAGSLRLQFEGRPNRYVVVRLDQEVIWEFDVEHRVYTEQLFQTFKDRRKHAETKRKQAREALLQMHEQKRVDDAELEELLASIAYGLPA